MKDTWFDELAAKHRSSGVLLDAGLLVLWVAGAIDRSLIRRHKRLANYRVNHYDALAFMVAQFSRWITTPHLLAEASNLARQSKESIRRQLLEGLSQIVQATDERQLIREEHVPASLLCRRPQFVTLGVADTAIVEVGHMIAPLILTDDNALLAQCQQEELDAISVLRLEIR